jgi:hypothetical protein
MIPFMNEINDDILNGRVHGGGVLSEKLKFKN